MLNEQRCVMCRLLAISGMSVIMSLFTNVGIAQRVEEGRLLPDSGTWVYGFGYAIATDGAMAVIGGAGIGTPDRGGAAWVYDLDTGNLIHRLEAADGHEGNSFGRFVDISGTTLLIGAIGDNGLRSDSGAAYLFEAASGQQLRKLYGDLSPGSKEEAFGISVAIDGPVALVGAEGWVYEAAPVYVYDVATGELMHRFYGPGGWSAFFGRQLAADRGIAAVSASGASGFGPQHGVVFLYDPASGEQLATVTPADGREHQTFGFSVALGQSMLLVGSWPTGGWYPGSGSVYVYDVQDPSVPIEVATLSAAAGRPDDHFGVSAAISASRIVIGAYQHDHGADNSGAAYLFDLATLAEVDKLVTSRPTTNGYMGSMVALRDGQVLVGTPDDDSLGPDVGAVLLFDDGLGSDLIIAPPTPGRAGEVNTLLVGNADSGRRVYLVWSDFPGSASVPLCPDLRVDLRRPDVAAVREADGSGVATFDVDVPARFAGELTFVQAVAPSRCVKSRTLTIMWE